MKLHPLPLWVQFSEDPETHPSNGAELKQQPQVYQSTHFLSLQIINDFLVLLENTLFCKVAVYKRRNIKQEP